jgi:hypothetical protein
MIAPEELNIAPPQVFDQGHRKVSPRLIAEIRLDC